MIAIYNKETSRVLLEIEKRQNGDIKTLRISLPPDEFIEMIAKTDKGVQSAINNILQANNINLETSTAGKEEAKLIGYRKTDDKQEKQFNKILQGNLKDLKPLKDCSVSSNINDSNNKHADNISEIRKNRGASLGG